MNTQTMPERDLIVKDKFKLSSFLGSWEMVLVYILIAINLALMIFKPEIYFVSGNIATILRWGMDLSFMVLGMIFILILGDIDISVASIMVLSASVIGILYQSGVPSVIALLGGLATGAVCGAINGVLVAVVKMPSVIVTIATSMLYRGLVEIVLKGKILSKYPAWFSTLAWGNIGGIIPYSAICFLAVAVVFGFILHKSSFGRKLYIIGNNGVSARYSGINVTKVKIIAFTVMGITAAMSGVVFSGIFEGMSSGWGVGYELKVIAIAVLGGVSTSGGKGKIYGPVIATVIMAFLTMSLDQFNIHANVQKIIIGVILLIAVMISIISKWASALKKKVVGMKNA